MPNNPQGGQNTWKFDILLSKIEQIGTTNNIVNRFTKGLSHTLFYKHSDVIMCRIPLPYYKGNLCSTYEELEHDYPIYTIIIINMLRYKHEEAT